MRAILRNAASAALAAMFTIGSTADAQTQYKFVDGEWVAQAVEILGPGSDNIEPSVDALSLLAERDSLPDVSALTFPQWFYLPTVFEDYDMHLGNVNLDEVKLSDDWLENLNATRLRGRQFKQRYMIDNASDVRYNIATLPEAPKQYIAVVDPSKVSITVEEVVVDPQALKDDVKEVEIKRVNWLHDFSGLIQFSQAYNSPNWYQGGNNNLNMIINAIWNVKLNPAYHPNLLFENTVAYKLAMNSAPDDSLRNYSISEDLFQINSKFGVKALKNWYYSATLQFKTQLLNNYRTNTYDLAAAFMSPAELNIGIGMTYTLSGKNFNFNASIAPLSYNLKTCLNDRLNVTAFGIEEGHKTVSQIGSNIDCKLTWNIAHNIALVSHLTAFTNYSYLQSDWENTLSFTINKFLSTQIYAHLRYDSQGARFEDTRWRKWQVKEILSFGFAYKISTI